MADSSSSSDLSLSFPLVLPDATFCDQFFDGAEESKQHVQEYKKLYDSLSSRFVRHEPEEVTHPYLPQTYPIQLTAAHVDDHRFLFNTWKSLASVDKDGFLATSSEPAKLWHADAKEYVPIPFVAVQSPPHKSLCVGKIMEGSNIRRTLEELKNRRVCAKDVAAAFGINVKNGLNDEEIWNLPSFRPDRMRPRMASYFVLQVHVNSEPFGEALKSLGDRAFSETVDESEKHSGDEWERISRDDHVLVMQKITDLLRTLVFTLVPISMKKRDGRSPYMLHVDGTPLLCDNPIAACAFLLAFANTDVYDDWPERLARSRFCQYFLYRICYDAGYMDEETVSKCMCLITCCRYSREKSAVALKDYVHDRWTPMSFVRKKAKSTDKAVVPSYSMFSTTFCRAFVIAHCADACDGQFDLDTPQFFRRQKMLSPVEAKKARRKTKMVVFNIEEAMKTVLHFASSPTKTVKKYDGIVGLPLNYAFGLRLAFGGSDSASDAEKVDNAIEELDDGTDSAKFPVAPKGITVGQVADILNKSDESQTPRKKQRKRDTPASSSSATGKGKSKRRRASKSTTAATSRQDMSEDMNKFAQTVLNGMGELFERFATRLENAVQNASGAAATSARHASTNNADVMKEVRSFIAHDGEKTRKRATYDDKPDSSSLHTSTKHARTSEYEVSEADESEDDSESGEDDECSDNTDDAPMEDGEPSDLDEVYASTRRRAGVKPVVGVSDDDDIDENDSDVYDSYTRKTTVHGKRATKMSLEEYETIRTKINDVDDGDEFDDDWGAMTGDNDESESEVESGGVVAEKQPVDEDLLQHVRFVDIDKKSKRDVTDKDIVITEQHMPLFYEYLAVEGDEVEYDPERSDDVQERWRALPRNVRSALKTYMHTCLSDDLCIGYATKARANNGASSSGDKMDIDPCGSIGFDVLTTLRNLPREILDNGEVKQALRAMCKAETRKAFYGCLTKVHKHIKRHNKKHKDSPSECAKMELFGQPSLISICEPCRKAAQMSFQDFYSKYFYLVHGDDKMKKKEKLAEARRWHNNLAALYKASPPLLDRKKEFSMQKDSWCVQSGYPFYTHDGPRSRDQIAYVVMSPQERALEPSQRRNHSDVNAGARVLFKIPQAKATHDPLFHPIAQMREHFVDEVKSILAGKTE